MVLAPFLPRVALEQKRCAAWGEARKKSDDRGATGPTNRRQQCCLPWPAGGFGPFACKSSEIGQALSGATPLPHRTFVAAAGGTWKPGSNQCWGGIRGGRSDTGRSRRRSDSMGRFATGTQQAAGGFCRTQAHYHGHVRGLREGAALAGRGRARVTARLRVAGADAVSMPSRRHRPPKPLAKAADRAASAPLGIWLRPPSRKTAERNSAFGPRCHSSVSGAMREGGTGAGRRAGSRHAGCWGGPNWHRLIDALPRPPFPRRQTETRAFPHFLFPSTLTKKKKKENVLDRRRKVRQGARHHHRTPTRRVYPREGGEAALGRLNGRGPLIWSTTNPSGGSKPVAPGPEGTSRWGRKKQTSETGWLWGGHWACRDPRSTW